jgi:hypothetical protein
MLCLSLSHWKKKVKSSLYVDYYPCDAWHQLVYWKT